MDGFEIFNQPETWDEPAHIELTWHQDGELRQQMAITFDQSAVLRVMRCDGAPDKATHSRHEMSTWLFDADNLLDALNARSQGPHKLTDKMDCYCVYDEGRSRTNLIVASNLGQSMTLSWPDDELDAFIDQARELSS